MMTRRVLPMRGPLAAAAGAPPVPAGVTVRTLGADDGPRLGLLMADAYRGTTDDPGQDDAWFRRDAEATLRGEYGTVVWTASTVAAEGNDLLGTCLVTDDGRHLLLAFALVVPRWRGRGVGSALIARSASALQDRGYAEWTLAVTEGNPARALYDRLGFRVDLTLRGS